MKYLQKKFKKSQYAAKFLTNTGWIVFDKVFHMGLSLIVTAMVSRYLGPDKYGILNYGLAFIEIFTIICKLGIDGIIVNELIKQKEREGEILGTTICLRLISSMLSLLLTYGFVTLLNPGKGVVIAVTLIQSVSLVFVSFDTLDYYFQSRLQSKYTALARSVSYPLVCLTRVMFVFIKSETQLFAWATVLDAITISVILIFFYYRQKEHQKLKCSAAMIKYLLSNSYHFIFVNLLVTIYTQMDKLMVGAMSSQREVGLYSAGMLIANLWIFIPNAIIDSGRPIVMTLKAEGRKLDYIKRMRQLSAGIIWISILAAIFFSLSGKWVIGFIYGNEFLEAGSVLLILIWSRLFSLLGALRSVWMLCEGQERNIKYFIGIGAVINVILNVLLIPKMGAVGAAIATMITEILSSFVATGLYKKTRPLFNIYIEALLIRKCIEK